jgi:transketolase
MQLGEQAGLKPAKPMRDFFGEAILAVARDNPRVVVLDGDLGNSTKAETVRQAFPERFFNIGIAESNLVGIGAGLAACDLIPWITSFSSFLLCNAYDQIRLAVALSNINAKILGSHGGITLGKDGPTQMGIEDFALMGGLPTMQMLVPVIPFRCAPWWKRPRTTWSASGCVQRVAHLRRGSAFPVGATVQCAAVMT